MKSIKKVLSILLATCLMFSIFAFTSACNNQEPPEQSGGNQETIKIEDVVDFVVDVKEGSAPVILQLADIQIIDSSQCRTEGRLTSWAKNEWAPENIDRIAFDYVRKTVQTVKPDLIVLSGDNTYGEFDDNGSNLQKLVQLMDSFEIPWTACYGNHDTESHKGVEWMNAQYENSKFGHFKKGDEGVFGNGNFTVGIRQGDKLTGVIYLMDSHGSTISDRELGITSKVELDQTQVDWFKASQNEISQLDKDVPTIGFWHHPTYAFLQAMVKYGYSSFDLDIGQGENSLYPIEIPEDNEFGDSGALVSKVNPSQYIDSEYEFHNLLRDTGVLGWFFGHYHKNNASASYEGVRYTYGVKSSLYDEYPAGKIGGTKITLDKNLKVEQVFVTI